MDEETSRAWNKWFDQRLGAALEAERERFEQRLNKVQVETLTLVSEAFRTNGDAVTKYISDAIAEGITKSAAHAEKLLTEFHATVRNVLEQQHEPISGPREAKTLN